MSCSLDAHLDRSDRAWFVRFVGVVAVLSFDEHNRCLLRLSLAPV